MKGFARIAVPLLLLLLASTASAQIAVKSNAEVVATDFVITDFAAKALIKGTPVDVSKFSRISVRVTCAASDTDSVAIVVYAVGKSSGTILDGLDYLFDSRPDTVGAQGWLVASEQQRLYNAGDIIVQNAGITTFGVGGGITSPQVTFPLADIRGNRISTRMLGLWVLNRTNTQIDDVTIEIVGSTN